MYNVSENIRYYRELIGMTRKQLAEGICDASTLYRIEKGEQIPRLDVLTGICHKLRIPLDFMVSQLNHIELAKIEKYKKLCRELTYQDDYQALSIILDEFKKLINNIESEPEIQFNKRFIKWHEAIYLHEVESNSVKAKEILKSIYSGQIYTELDIGICNSLGYIKLKEQSIDISISYFKSAFNAIHDLPFIIDKTLPPLVGYNLAYCYYYQWKMNEAITVCYQVLEHLEINQLSFKLGDTKHMLAKIYQRLGEFELAYELLTQSIHLYNIESKVNKYDKAKKDLQDLDELRINY
ncbi:helix-turn-helix domain-containing protein [Tenuibacillus multivorans]|uniref:Helix-turn-helix n=1 Tax=Tenuibacillus multivorans TaxID=237069 RepID=A0A1G9YLG5_9BACI|nr:helix-turn-helix transcriptional regulator [Tenuibacillus multivorans]GEL78464.1 hypothetical protein TMU01_26990 [Tenuibacillus multivorans]SDN10059.1 Helix-turn-helix [Tenuibacillus multivorans]